ncbi:MAG: hypothetical protein HY834_15350 [Devosia nanyangense]|uniref:Lipoprotein n=1 Tax=Devosia nanyangense TaxID=1228055 RepID=A0A933NXN4_9HYPH|nr:hypothetical protein [Devosia nanyangense]
MNFALIGRMAGALALSLSLAGCIDMTTDVYVTSATTAKATVTQTMAADIYAMVKAADDSGSSDSKPFCKEEGQTLTENENKSGTCVIVSEGVFADLKFDDSGAKPTFTDNGDGTVRVAVTTKDMMGEMGSQDDPQTAAMMKQMFEGHFLTIRFGGPAVTDTNMTLNDDGTYAEIKIPFLDLLNGTADLPEELYAVVDTN